MPKPKEPKNSNLSLEKNLKQALYIILFVFGGLQLAAAFVGNIYALINAAVLILAGILYIKDYQRWYNYLLIAYSTLEIANVFDIYLRTNIAFPTFIFMLNTSILLLSATLIMVSKKEPSKKPISNNSK